MEILILGGSVMATLLGIYFFATYKEKQEKRKEQNLENA
jgi:hypothetical protein